MEKSEHDRRRSLPGSYAYAGRNPAEDERVRIYGVSEREE